MYGYLSYKFLSTLTMSASNTGTVEVIVCSNNFHDVVSYFDDEGKLRESSTRIRIRCQLCTKLLSLTTEKMLIPRTDEPYTVLKCGHAFDSYCLFAYVANEMEKEDKSAKCPTCDAPIYCENDIHPVGVYGWQRNQERDVRSIRLGLANICDCKTDSSSDGSSSDSDDDSSNGDSSADDDDDDESDDADEEEDLPSKDSSSSQLFAYGFFMGSLCIFSFAFEVKHFTHSLFNIYPEEFSGPFSVVRTVLRNRFLFLAVVAGFLVTFPVIYIPVVNRVVFIDWEWRVVAAAVIAYITFVETWKAGKRRLFYRSSKLAVNGGTSLYKIDDYVPLARRPADTMVMIPLGALLASQARRRRAHRNRRMARLARIDHNTRGGKPDLRPLT
ncbi:hypothetical protein EV127DRAFT_471161 [Xylaria flabelliformis]|nr:hypothetical protein EV127DRAFT_471161 [Xylaria flabelliformis]